MIGEATDLIRNAKKLNIISHHDSDGVSSAAIAVFVAKRLGLNYNLEVKNQLTPEDINGGDGVYWFNDMGSARLNEIKGVTGVITDHHHPSVLESHYTANGNNIFQFNPHLEGLDGGISQSGSTTTFLFSSNLLPEARMVSHLSVVGAVGDLHDKKYRKLIDTNREIMLLAKDLGLIELKEDISYFGRSSKSIAYMIRFGSDPRINSLYDDPVSVKKFLVSHGFDPRDISTIRWIELNDEKRSEIIADLSSLIDREGGDPKRLTGEVYELRSEVSSSTIRDIRDFASLINATARNGKPEVGVRLCLFERGKVMEEALQLYSSHSDTLRQASRLLEETDGVMFGNVLYYDFGSRLENNITGTVATRIITHKRIPTDYIVIVMADLEGKKKISGRISIPLSEKVDLSELFTQAASAVGGKGGGHRTAAGALVPIGKERGFIEKVNELMTSQST